MVSEPYHKIPTPFKRDMYTHKLMMGDWVRPEFKYLADNRWEFTEKVDGTNIRIRMVNLGGEDLSVTYAGRTDNAAIPPRLLEALEAQFPTMPTHRRELHRPAYRGRNEALLKWMNDNDLDAVTFYGEGYGPKIQGGGKYREDHSFVLFDVKIGGFWLDRANIEDIARELDIHVVPKIGEGTLWNAIDIVKGNVWSDRGVLQPAQPFKSAWGDFTAEGIIAKPLVPLFNRKGERIVTKIKVVDFV